MFVATYSLSTFSYVRDLMVSEMTEGRCYGWSVSVLLGSGVVRLIPSVMMLGGA